MDSRRNFVENEKGWETISIFFIEFPATAQLILFSSHENQISPVVGKFLYRLLQEAFPDLPSGIIGSCHSTLFTH